VLTIKAMGTTTTCTPGNSPKPSLELQVTARRRPRPAARASSVRLPAARPRRRPARRNKPKEHQR
ncbi:hypothetical protein ACFW7P_27825, partial [Streptomyces albidoflavus]